MQNKLYTKVINQHKATSIILEFNEASKDIMQDLLQKHCKMVQKLRNLNGEVSEIISNDIDLLEDKIMSNVSNTYYNELYDNEEYQHIVQSGKVENFVSHMIPMMYSL